MPQSASEKLGVIQIGPYPPPYGGVEINLVLIRRYLQSRNVPTAVVNLSRYRKAEEDEIYYPSSAWQLMRRVWRLKHPIIHLHLGGNVTLRLLLLWLFCCAIPGRKTVLTFHSGGYPSSPAGKTARPFTLRGFTFRRIDRLIAVNEEIRQMFLRFGVPEDRIRIIAPHWVPERPSDSVIPLPIRDFMRRHDPLLVTVSGLEPEYDLESPIATLAVVREVHPNAGLMIVGSGTLDLGLRDAIRAKPYADDILMTGDIAHEATLAIVAAARLFLRTTLYDGDAISVREALALGVPVIATATRFRPPGVILIPVSDREALAEAILNALQSKGREDKAAGGNVRGEENVEAVFNLYQELAG